MGKLLLGSVLCCFVVVTQCATIRKYKHMNVFNKILSSFVVLLVDNEICYMNVNLRKHKYSGFKKFFD